MMVKLINIEYVINSFAFTIYKMNENFRKRGNSFKSGLWKIESMDSPQIKIEQRKIFLYGECKRMDKYNGTHQNLNEQIIKEINFALEDWDKNWEGNIQLVVKKTEDILKEWI